MSNLTPTPDDAENIPAWDESTPLLGGGPTAPMNMQAQGLLNKLMGYIEKYATGWGASAIGFIQAGTGALIETIQTVLRRNVYAESFGAVGDGTTDCHDAIMAALTDYPNGVVNLGAGTFIVSAPIDKPVGATIRGQGMDKTIIKMKNGVNAAAVIRTVGFASLTGTTSTGGEFNSEISHLTIDGNKANNTTGIGIQLYGKNFRLYDFRIQNCAQSSLYTEYGGADDFSTLAGTLETYVSKFFLQNSGGTGFVMHGPHDMYVDTGIILMNTGYGLENTQSMTVNNVNTYLNTLGGGWTHSAGSIAGSGLVGSTATGVGWWLQSGGNNVTSSSFGGPIGLQISANNNFIQGVVANTTSKGLFLDGASAQVVADLVMFNNTGTIFDVSTASLKSQIRAFMGDSLGTLQNGGFPGTWQINGYTGFAGASTEISGSLIIKEGKLCPPNADVNRTSQAVNGIFFSNGIPTSGSFTKGDVVFNTNATVGSPKGWRRLTSGSNNVSGTDWSSEGNL